jgi:tripartite-type tricarboxylate transporter receptor subunit TctC
MKLPRRTFLRIAAGFAALPALPLPARAQGYPTRPVYIMVGLAAGGGLDILARLLGMWLSERLGEPVVIENRPGAATNLATEAVVRAPPDGYTLLMAATTNAINATLYNNLTFNFIRDIAPVASTTRSPLVMVVNPAFPARTVPAFIAYAKANPGKVSFASGGNGTPLHVAGELLKTMTGIEMVHVPYKGAAPALADLLGGQVQMIFSDLPSAIAYIRAGKLRALAVTTAARAEALPDVPVLGDFVTGYEASLWQGLAAPKGTPAEVINRLNATINAGLADPALRARLADLGSTAFAGSPTDFGKLIADDTAKWAKVVRAANLRPE